MNVLHVLSDQHLATCIGAAGHPQAITPNMDRLAREGVMFTQSYAANTVCTPNRVSLLSGQYCHNHGYYGLSGPPPASLPSYLGHFREHGHRTAGIGKLHLPDQGGHWLDGHVDLLLESYPDGNAGYGDTPGTCPYLEYLDELGLRHLEDSAGLPEFPGMQQIEGRPSNLPFEHSIEGWTVQRAIDFMSAGSPFCLQVSLPRPHQCFTPDVRFWDMYPDDIELPPTFDQDPSHRPPFFQRTFGWYQRYEGLIEPKGREHVARRVWRAYLACVTHVDHALGLLLDSLDEAGLTDDTIVIYGSDHGAYSGTHGLLEKAPGICSDAVCRVPSIWRVPGVPPRVSDALTEHVDVSPTIVSLCGLPPMETVDGADISGLLNGSTDNVRDVAVTENAWSKSLRWNQWRFVHYQRDMYDGGELYDIESDPDERLNRYDDPSCADVVAECRRLLLEWMIRTTRVVSPWPAPSGKMTWPLDYKTAADGKASNEYGPDAIVRLGQTLNYL